MSDPDSSISRTSHLCDICNTFGNANRIFRYLDNGALKFVKNWVWKQQETYILLKVPGDDLDDLLFSLELLVESISIKCVNWYSKEISPVKSFISCKTRRAAFVIRTHIAAGL